VLINDRGQVALLDPLDRCDSAAHRARAWFRAVIDELVQSVAGQAIAEVQPLHIGVKLAPHERERRADAKRCDGPDDGAMVVLRKNAIRLGKAALGKGSEPNALAR